MTSPMHETDVTGEGRASEMRLADGRRVRWRDWGNPAGFPVVALHGLPGSGRKFSGTHALGLARGQRIIAPDRWGYGGTDRHPAPSLAAFAADTAALADHLGIGRFAVLGVSGGGPYAAAVAACLGARIAAVALVSPVGPIEGVGVRPTMSAFHHLCFRVLPRTPAVLPAAFHLFRLACLRAGPLACRITTMRAPPIDRETLRRPDVGPRLAATFREGLAPGIAGPMIDMGLFARPWGIDLGRIAAPSRVWIGARDTNVPVAAARLLARQIPGADCVELGEAGHLWLALHYADVLDWIESAGQRASADVMSARVSGTP